MEVELTGLLMVAWAVFTFFAADTMVLMNLMPKLLDMTVAIVSPRFLPADRDSQVQQIALLVETRSQVLENRTDTVPVKG